MKLSRSPDFRGRFPGVAAAATTAFLDEKRAKSGRTFVLVPFPPLSPSNYRPLL